MNTLLTENVLVLVLATVAVVLCLSVGFALLFSGASDDEEEPPTFIG